MQQQRTTVKIPDDIDFADLKLARDADGAVSFDWSPIELICEASGIDVQMLRDGPEDNISALIVTWYMAHRQAGGEPDFVQEDLIAETLAEESAGQKTSFPPGRA